MGKLSVIGTSGRAGKLAQYSDSVPNAVPFGGQWASGGGLRPLTAAGEKVPGPSESISIRLLNELGGTAGSVDMRAAPSGLRGGVGTSPPIVRDPRTQAERTGFEPILSGLTSQGATLTALPNLAPPDKVMMQDGQVVGYWYGSRFVPVKDENAGKGAPNGGEGTPPRVDEPPISSAPSPARVPLLLLAAAVVVIGLAKVL